MAPAAKPAKSRAHGPTSAAKPRARRAQKPGAKATKTKSPKEPKRLSTLSAAAQVLAGSKVPMRAKELIAQMEARHLWKSPGGQTPESTLYTAMTREITKKGAASRFKKHERGVFVAGGAGGGKGA